MQIRSALLGAAGLAILAAGCTTEPKVTTVTLNSTSVTLDAIGATSQLTATLKDQDGKTLTDRTVSWTSSDAAVATVSSAGLVTAVGNGSATVSASSGGVSATASVTVAQAVSGVAKALGDGQTGTVGAALAANIAVDVTDRLSEPIAGTTVAFAVTAGGGSVASASVATDASGRASTSWTLGTTAADAQTVRATAGSQSVTFSATAEAGPADALEEVSGNNQSGAAGTELPNPIVVRVVDEFDNPVADHAVDFQVNTGGGSVNPTTITTATNGQASSTWTLGATPGAQQAQASASGVTTGSPAVFNATATVGSIAVNDGDGQTALVDYAPNVQPSVIVKDDGGSPLAGVTVTFAVQSGGGSVAGAVQVTNAQGIAQVGKWTVGATPGANTLSATASGVGFTGNPVLFSATGAAAAYNIEVRYLTTLTASQQAAFDEAAARWERLVYGDLVNTVVNVGANACGTTHPAINETVDDLLILTRVETIDGVGGILGQAGPCVLRASGNLPALGIMRFDSDDLANLEANNQLKDVILHEMGHVLGFGGLWGPSWFDFLRNPSLPDPPGEDTYFSGPIAIAAFDSLGGTSYTGGQKVPVENTQGGQGTRDAHWRESVFNAELMTGFISAPGTANPLSYLSVASLWDMGYTVNYDDADTYTQVFTGPALAAGVSGKLALVNDVWRGPIYVIDETTGEVRRVVRH